MGNDRIQEIKNIRLKASAGIFMISLILNIDMNFIADYEGEDSDKPLTEEMWAKYQRLEKVIDAVGLFGQSFFVFMTTPRADFGGKAATDLLDSDDDLKIILDFIERDQNRRIAKKKPS